MGPKFPPHVGKSAKKNWQQFRPYIKKSMSRPSALCIHFLVSFRGQFVLTTGLWKYKIFAHLLLLLLICEWLTNDATVTTMDQKSKSMFTNAAFFRFQDNMSLASCLFHSYLEKESIKSIRIQCTNKSSLKFVMVLSFFLIETKINYKVLNIINLIRFKFSS